MGRAVSVALCIVATFAGCAAPLARGLAGGGADRAVEAAAADDGIPSAAEAGLAFVAQPAVEQAD